MEKLIFHGLLSKTVKTEIFSLLQISKENYFYKNNTFYIQLYQIQTDIMKQSQKF